MLAKLNVLTGIAGAVLVAAVLGPNPGAAQAARETIKVPFAYHPADTAERIYSHLQAVAHNACADRSSRSLRLAWDENACASDLLARAVARIGRSDLAALHQAQGAAKDASPVAIARR